MKQKLKSKIDDATNLKLFIKIKKKLEFKIDIIGLIIRVGIKKTI